MRKFGAFFLKPFVALKRILFAEDEVSNWGGLIFFVFSWSFFLSVLFGIILPSCFLGIWNILVSDLSMFHLTYASWSTYFLSVLFVTSGMFLFFVGSFVVIAIKTFRKSSY